MTNDRFDTPDRNDDSTGSWWKDKRYIEGQLRDLKSAQRENHENHSKALTEITTKLSEIETELRAYKRAVQILLAIGSLMGAVFGWFAKAMGKGI